MKWSIYHLKKDGSQKLDNFLIEDILEQKEDIINFNLEYQEDKLFRFPLADSFKEKENVSGYIYVQKQLKDKQYWLPEVNKISRDDIDIQNLMYNFKTLILFNVDRKIYAVSYSYGYTLLNQDFIVSDFGLKIAKNELNLSELKKIKKTVIQNTLINTTASSTSPMPVRKIFNNENLNIVNEVMGKTKIPISAKNGEIKSLNLHIWGENSVEVSGNLSIEDDLISLIQNLGDLYKQKDKEKVIFKNELRRVPRHSEKKLILEKLLPYFETKYKLYKENSNEVLNKDLEEIELNLATSKIKLTEELPEFQFRINGVFRNGEYIDYIDNNKEWIISKLFQKISNKIGDEKLTWENFYREILIKTKINYKYISEEGEIKIGRLSNLYESLYYECVYQNKKYLLLQGRWYFLDQNIWKIVKETVNSIPKDESDINFDAFKIDDRETSGKRSEGKYNERIAELNSDIFCLDKRDFTNSSLGETKFSDYDLNPNSKVEPCDLLKLGETYTFCHIKTGSQSAKLSHLLIQTKASCELIKSSHEFIEHINTTLENIRQEKNITGTEKIEINNLKKVNVILGCIVAENKVSKLNSNAFPVLFNLNLASLYEELTEKGFNVSLVKIADKNIR